MSLIPVSAAVAPKVPAGRPGASVTSQPSLAPSRTHGAARSNGAAAAGKSVKAKGGFASVLETVQQDAGHAETGRTRTAVASPVRVSGAEDVQAEPRRSQDVSSEPDAQRVVQPAAPTVVPQTPWLLLALGSGSRSWQETDSGGQGTDEVAGVDEVGVDVDARPDGAALVAPLSSGFNAVQVTTAVAVEPTAGLAVSAGFGDGTPISETGAEVGSDARETTLPLAEASEGVSAAPSDVRPDELVAEFAKTPSGLSATDQSVDAGADTATASAPLKPTESSAVVGRPGSEGHEPPSVVVAPLDAQVDTTRQAVRPTGRAASWLGQQARTTATAAGAPSAVPAAIASDASGAAPTQVPVPREAFRFDDARPTGAELGRRATHEAPAFAPVPHTAQVEVPLPASVQAAASAALPPAVGEQVLNQIVTSVRMQWKDGIGEAKLQLRPDALGTVNVSLKVEAGAVTAVVRADSPEVQEWVVKHQETLRQQMEAAGLNLAELVVNPDDRGQTRQEAPPQQRRPRQAVMAAQTRRFEELL